MITDTALFLSKEEKLQEVARTLKENFIGVDEVIDEFIHQIHPWYITPQLLDRPTVINLWGMTGVGKTDLVRQFVKLIDFQDRFLDIELSNSQRSAYSDYESSVSGILIRNKLFDTNPSILFFDEFQHFRTIDQDGKEISERRFQDFWELLSDGKLSKRDVAGEFEEIMLELVYEDIRGRATKPTSEEAAPTFQSPWLIRRLKKLLDTGEFNHTMQSLLAMPNEEIIGLLESSRKTKKMFDTVDFSKALIIIGGNLDTLYSMSALTSESEIDANIFHDQTKKLNVVDVKRALEDRFRPEQISRLGNTHIIYPSLSTDNFKKLIQSRLKTTQERVKKETGIEVIFDASIEALIYRNGVFPTQGVRPVFSAISEILVSRLSDWILNAIKSNQTKCIVAYEQAASQFKVSFPEDTKQTYSQDFRANLDKVRSGKSRDEQALVAVHEAGHAVVYSILFKVSPLQLKSRLASADKSGFTFPHKIELSKENLEHQLQVLVAGFLAEELIYGAQNVTSGHRLDIERATHLASAAVRELNFSRLNGKVVTPFDSNSSQFKTDIEISNKIIDEMLTFAMKKCRTLLQKNKAFLLHIAADLLEAGYLEPQEFIRIASKHGVVCEQQPESWVVMAQYEKKLVKAGS